MQKLARCQLVAKVGKKIRTAPPGFSWYQHDIYGFHNGTEFVTLRGRVQIRYRDRRYDVLTLNDKGDSVRGYDLNWLIGQNGYELITDDEYRFNLEQAEADKHNPNAALLRWSGDET